jgi:hypothetical protein
LVFENAWPEAPAMPQVKAKSVRSGARPRNAERPFRREDDYHAWLIAQAALLRSQNLTSVDWSDLAEELEAMAASQRRELLERLTTLIADLLKLRYQPGEIAKRGRGWRLTVVRSRREIKQLLEESPGLKSKLEEYVFKVYPDAQRDAGIEMGLEQRAWVKLFSTSCPLTLDQLMDDDFLS